MEIKPQELRLNNLVEWNKEACTVQSIRGNDIGLYDRNKALICTTTKLIKPIKLTPEWFKRSGFKEYQYTKEALLLSGSDTYVKTYTFGKLTICDWGDGKFILTNAFSFDLRVEIKTLHHLQNVVYALTGEELAIDKTSLKN